MNEAQPKVGVLMGSASDWPTLQHAAAILAEFGIAHECRVVSAHRMPDEMFAEAFGTEWFIRRNDDGRPSSHWLLES